MLKRLLVALDPDQDTAVATRYAIEIARDHEADVSGLAIVHSQRIAAEIGPGGAVGAMHYAAQLREKLTLETRQSARDLVEAFNQQLESAGVRHAEMIREGVPYRRIIEDMKYHDLLLIGRTPRFFYPRPEKKTHTLTRVVKEGIAPTLVVPETFREVKRVLIAYDGSDPAARTMQRFAQLQPFGKDLELELVHVRPWVSQEIAAESELMLRLAADYLRAHGFEMVRETSLEMDAPDRRVLAYANEIEADMIVAGAHSVSAMNRLAFGSTTHALLKSSEVPFFMYH